MSYLNSPRIHFRGWFQADVSTINNDVRCFQNSSFVPEYQQLNQNGSWNPEGTGIFRILDCAVTGGFLHGQPLAGDPVLGMTVQNADQRAPGKLVDLDPQQQMVSEIWGMQVRLVDGNLQTAMRGEFLPAAFSNLWQRQKQGVRRDQLLGANYQSVLTGVEWAGMGVSPVLDALAEASSEGMLSIAFNVFGYGRDSTIPRYTMGHIVGTIGPYKAGEPKHFVAGRQMVANAPQSFTQPAGGVGNVQAVVDGLTVTADFGNSFPVLDANSGLTDMGPVYLGVLGTSVQALQATATAADVAVIGEVGYQDANWYTRTAGVQTFDLTNNPMAVELLKGCPLVLLTPIQGSTGYNVILQETIGGLYVRSDHFVYRMDPGATKTVELYATGYGAALGKARINLAATEGMMGGSGGGDTIAPPARPAAAIPDILQPADGVTFPDSVTTDERGYAAVTLTASADGPGNPRNYIFGQMYGMAYRLAAEPAGYITNPLNYVSILAYRKKDVPEKPTWYGDIQELFTQYGNLYPIMGKYVVNLRDYASVVQRIGILRLAFSLPVEDANHMPVTRDMGAGDRATILQWLETKGPDGLPLLGRPSAEPPEIALAPAAAPSVPLEPVQKAGKTSFILQYEARRKRRGEGQ